MITLIVANWIRVVAFGGCDAAGRKASVPARTAVGDPRQNRDEVRNISLLLSTPNNEYYYPNRSISRRLTDLKVWVVEHLS